MNNIDVANLELCKDLYKLSGWTTDWEWYIDPEGRQSLTYVPGGTVDVYDDDTLYPAYDLGYLVRKLPPQLNDYWLIIGPTKLDKWSAGYLNGLGALENDTPENAACKLAIELFKQGVLDQKA